MYREYFGLKEFPFSISPDPHYFYVSEGHREALAHLMYGMQVDGGFVLLTGEVGTGKTMVCRRLLENVPGNCEIAFILNPKLSSAELLAAICDEFRVSYPEDTRSIKDLVDRLNNFLLDIHEKGRKAILIIEEAQNLSVEVLEQVRLLTNLETSQRKLLQIIMLGQPELRDMLAKPELRQLSQRITARYHLGPLAKNEIPSYINHRLSVAGLVRGELFPRPTVEMLSRLTGGVPRLLNIMCDRALLGTYLEGKERIDKQTLVNAAREVSGEKINHSTRKKMYCAAGIVLSAVLIGTGMLYGLHKPIRDIIFRSHTIPAKNAKDTIFDRINDEARQASVEKLRTQYGSSPVCDRPGNMLCLDGKNNPGTAARFENSLKPEKGAN